jgi:hypothetical protein
MLATSVPFVEAVSEFLSIFYAELTDGEDETMSTETWILVCSIVRHIFEEIAFHRGRASRVEYKNDDKGQVSTEFLGPCSRPNASWPTIPRMSSATTLRLRRSSTIICTVIACRG